MLSFKLLLAWLVLATPFVCPCTGARASGLGMTPQRVRAASRALRVDKQYGASLRVAPSSEARIEQILGCGAYLRVLGQNAGWYYVSYVDAVTPITTGWVGKARVAGANAPLSSVCAHAVTFQVGQHVYTRVASGCLSLRVSASRSAVYFHCVSNYHDYVIVNGPIAVGVDDWFQVTSRSTGIGWALAQYLRPYSQ
jgi:hypothetical protein